MFNIPNENMDILNQGRNIMKRVKKSFRVKNTRKISKLQLSTCLSKFKVNDRDAVHLLIIYIEVVALHPNDYPKYWS